MVRAKAITIVVAAVLAAGSVGVWLLSERQAARQRSENFFSTSKEFPTSGGKKMKPEW